jgi:hypothetical protein
VTLADFVAAALRELRTQFGDDNVSHREDGSGGALVRIATIDLPSPPYNSPTWLGFQVPYTYPACEIYPVFVRRDLRIDGVVKPPLGLADFDGAPALAISRKPKSGSSGTAVIKALKVIAFLWEQAR